MKRLTLLIMIVLVCSNTWSQSIKIHHIGVGQGDATLILVDNGSGITASILIDAGNSASKGALVYSVVKKYLGGTTKQIDFLITSHLHSDHLGGMARLIDSLATNAWKVRYVVDRSANNEMAGGIDLCYDNGDDNITNDDAPAVPSNTLVSNYRKAVAKLKFEGWLNLQPGVDLMLALDALGFGGIATFRIVTSNGYVCTTADDYSKYKLVANNPHNENDYSYAFLLEMGEFKYFTGGDIGGGAPYVDLETPLVDLFKTRKDLKFHFCSYKASHHGSVNSTNAAFVTYTRPTVTVVPSALRSFSGTQLPGQQTLDRINNSSNNVYLFYTYMWTPGSTAASGKVLNYKDVIITLDKTTFNNTKNFTVETFDRDKTTLAVIGNNTSHSVHCYKH